MKWAAAILVALLGLATLIAVPVIAVTALIGETKEAPVDVCSPVILTGSYNGGTKSTSDLAADWSANAAVIIGVANQRGAGSQGAVVALATAMQESRLGNINYGDRDSLGLFQQRASWGSATDRLNPTWAANRFFDALLDPKNAGWETWPVTVAAQRVQRSGFPLAYGPWEALARSIVGGGETVAPDPSTPIAAGLCGGAQGPVSGDVAGVITAMEAYLNLPYSWGGGSLTGPTTGSGSGSRTVGFDCSSYVRYGYYKATGIVLPRTTREQYNAASIRITDRSQLQPGDLAFFASNPRVPSTIHHVVLIGAGGTFLHEPSTGDVAKYVQNPWQSSYWTSQFIGAIRPLSDPAFKK